MEDKVSEVSRALDSIAWTEIRKNKADSMNSTKKN
jgi:hypothetical protein